MKASFIKQVPKILNYRNYKYFNNDIFRDELMYEISKIGLNILVNSLKSYSCPPKNKVC